LNTNQFFLEDISENDSIDRWLREILSGWQVRQKALHGVTRTTKKGEYRVRLPVAGTRIDFGTFPDEELAGLFSDYISRDLLSEQAFNFPDKQLLGNADLKLKLRQMCSGAALSAASNTPVAEEFSTVKHEFWETVRDGHVFVCSSCHQTSFRKSVKLITDNLLAKIAHGGCTSAGTNVSEWVCGTCYRHLSKGKVPPICHLNYDSKIFRKNCKA
jgi:hypothetical protein